MTLYNYIMVYKMKLFALLALLPLASSTLLLGPRGDGKFLSHPTLIEAPCAAGEYNSLEVDVDGVKNYVGSEYVLNCKSCDVDTFMTDAGGYAQIIKDLVGDATVFHRPECCYNSEEPVCIEQIREYKRGCQSTGPYVETSNDAGFGPDSACASLPE
jgi:hypothetical protein